MEYEVGEAPDQSKEIIYRYGNGLVATPYSDDALLAKPEPTTILSKAIEQVEQMGNYKVMVALVNLDKTKPKEEQLHTFTDIESKRLREVIYKEMEKNFE